jgi:hypothetical protein
MSGKKFGKQPWRAKTGMTDWSRIVWMAVEWNVVGIWIIIPRVSVPAVVNTGVVV